MTTSCRSDTWDESSFADTTILTRSPLFKLSGPSSVDALSFTGRTSNVVSAYRKKSVPRPTVWLVPGATVATSLVSSLAFGVDLHRSREIILDAQHHRGRHRRLQGVEGGFAGRRLRPNAAFVRARGEQHHCGRGSDAD